MMTLDEAIRHAKEVADANRNETVMVELPDGQIMIKDKAECEKCAEEHEQLVQWLSELQALKELNKDEQYIRGYDDGYADAQREFKRSGKI